MLVFTPQMKAPVMSASSGSGSGGHSTAETEVELLFCRLLQATYLDVKV